MYVYFYDEPCGICQPNQKETFTQGHTQAICMVWYGMVWYMVYGICYGIILTRLSRGLPSRSHFIFNLFASFTFQLESRALNCYVSKLSCLDFIGYTLFILIILCVWAGGGNVVFCFHSVCKPIEAIDNAYLTKFSACFSLFLSLCHLIKTFLSAQYPAKYPRSAALSSCSARPLLCTPTLTNRN